MTTLRSFDFAASRTRNAWDWELLTNGQIHKMVKGEDYTAKYAAAQVRVYAKAHGLQVKISGGNPTDDEMVLQFVVEKKKAGKGKKITKKTEAPVEVGAE